MNSEPTCVSGRNAVPPQGAYYEETMITYWIVLLKCKSQEFDGWVTGYLVERNDDSVTIATRVHADGRPNQTLGIMRRQIEALLFLEEQQFFPKKD